MKPFQVPKTDQWKALSRNDWCEILELSRTKAFRRKFQIVEAFTRLVAEKGYHRTTHSEIALACGVTRQLIDHHFPDDRALMALTYRYIYARFQKFAADALGSREGALNQFRAYVFAIPQWIDDYRSDARFLANYYGIAPVYPDLLAFHERNTRIGQERIRVLLANLRDENRILRISDTRLPQYATSVQQQLIGYIILNSWRRPESPAGARHLADELMRSCLAVVGAR